MRVLRPARLRLLAVVALTMSALFTSPAAHAQERGCVVLLCLAGNWKGIPMCVAPVAQVLRDIARGRPFPTCSMSGAGNTANHQWASQANCPPFYSWFEENGSWMGCQYSGVISVRVNNALWSDVFWSMTGDTSTRYYDVARTALGANIDPTFDRDAARHTATPTSPADLSEHF